MPTSLANERLRTVMHPPKYTGKKIGAGLYKSERPIWGAERKKTQDLDHTLRVTRVGCLTWWPKLQDLGQTKLLPRDKAVQDLDLEAEAPFGTWVSLILSPSSLFWRSLFVVVVVAVVVGLFVVVVVFVCCYFFKFFALCLHHFPYFRVLIGIYFFFSCCCVHFNF